MRIIQLPDDHNPNRNHNHDDGDALPSFFGLKVTPQEPQTVTFRSCIRIVQATLGELTDKDSESDRSLLLCKFPNQPEIIVCSLRLKHKEMSRLDLVYNSGPNDVRFSVKGPFDIHLTGYLYDEHPAIPPDAQISSSKDQPSCSNELKTLINNAYIVPKSNTSSHLPSLNFPIVVHRSGIAPDIANALTNVNKEGDVDILPRRVIKALIEPLVKGMDVKLDGSNSVRQKLDYLLDNEVKEKAGEDPSHETTAEVNVHEEESEVNQNEVERASALKRMASVLLDTISCANSVRQKLDYLLENEVKENAVEDSSHGTTAQAIVHNEESEVNKNEVERRHGSPEYHVLQSRKSKRSNKRKKNDDDDQDDHIRFTAHDSLQTPEVDFAEARTPKKKSKKQKQAKVDLTRSTEHDSLQTPEVDFAEAEMPKKKSKKHKRAKVDHTRSTTHDSLQTLEVDVSESKKKKKKKKLEKQKEVEVNHNRAVHDDGLQSAAFDIGKVEKLQEHVVEDDCVSAGRGLPEHHTVDTRKAKRPKKSKKTEVVQEEARSQEARLIVLALPCHSKR